MSVLLPGSVRWIDLAALDAGASKAFYGRLFGWEARDEQALGGTFTRLARHGVDLGSLYQLGRREREAGWPQHWTPYVAVEDAESASRRAIALGGTAIAPAFDVPGMARIAVVADPGGAPIGLWQALEESHDPP